MSIYVYLTSILEEVCDRVLAVFLAKTLLEPKLELKIEGGGVWRLKFLDSGHTRDGSLRYTILASCMHAGKFKTPIVHRPF